eukprot:TRINITY_DN1646_c0_g1_i4.p1 TRINITY_DN1646_c0_g1~~TRINITY_DN1646_c0_g1_i4.p1  ORF type:complete len:388 (-),score=119.10 TRINITY_DN1646_c0_g1_i4:76-1239(-)
MRSSLLPRPLLRFSLVCTLSSSSSSSSTSVFTDGAFSPSCPRVRSSPAVFACFSQPVDVVRQINHGSLSVSMRNFRTVPQRSVAGTVMAAAAAAELVDTESSVPAWRSKPVPDEKVDEFLSSLRWDSRGLVVAIAQNVNTGAIMMQGFANSDAISATIASRRATFFSRSRQCLWTKGETSSNYINVVDVFIDCDGDAVVYLGLPDGPTCHTGAETCFFTRAPRREAEDGEGAKEQKGQAADREPHGQHEVRMTLYALEDTISERHAEVKGAAAAEAASNSASPQDGTLPKPQKKPSWTRKLLENPSLLCSKVREEAGELCEVWEKREGRERAVAEMADVLYHSMVLLNLQGGTMEEVMETLRKRFSQSGLEEKSKRRNEATTEKQQQ